MEGFTRVAPAEAGFDGDKLSAIDAIVKDAMENQNYAGVDKLLGGAQVAIARNGELVDHRCFGSHQLDTIYRAMSTTKAITSVGSMRLVQLGKLDLDDPVSKYIPAFASVKVFSEDGNHTPPKNPITVRDLHRHTSGLYYSFTIPNAKLKEAYGPALDEAIKISSLAEFVEKVTQLPLAFEPGEDFLYGVSTDVLGRVIEIVSGQSLEDYLNEFIFKPLDMNETSFSLPKEKWGRLAKLYSPFAGSEEIKRPDSDPYKTFAFPSGGGGLFITARDYLRFAVMLVNGGQLGDAKILEKNTVDIMLENNLAKPGSITTGDPANAIAIPGHSLAMVRSADGSEHHWYGAMNTWHWINPQKGLAIVVLGQQLPPVAKTFAHPVKEAVYAAMTP